MSWKKICELKCKGGLGFKNLKIFNMTLLAKQGWRILQDEKSLIHRYCKAKYFPTKLFFEAELERNPFVQLEGHFGGKKMADFGRPMEDRRL